MVEWFLRQGNNDGFDGNRLLKTYVLSMEDKMAAGAFGLARNYGRGGPFDEFDKAEGWST